MPPAKRIYIDECKTDQFEQKFLLERDETFGPVVDISRLKDIFGAIKLANGSPYGLVAVVFKGLEQMESGMGGVNQGAGGAGPWVDAKQSGFGFHSKAAGLDEHFDLGPVEREELTGFSGAFQLS
jgi:succinate-semialdehyde dehydrogenase/glutarate-semialdehyde dehydrogenase